LSSVTSRESHLGALTFSTGFSYAGNNAKAIAQRKKSEMMAPKSEKLI
jgi:hypothetical protein